MGLAMAIWLLEADMKPEIDEFHAQTVSTCAATALHEWITKVDLGLQAPMQLSVTIDANLILGNNRCSNWASTQHDHSAHCVDPEIYEL
jgi:hypothetical protein